METECVLKTCLKNKQIRNDSLWNMMKIRDYLLRNIITSITEKRTAKYIKA